jgi:hypothetical protein
VIVYAVVIYDILWTLTVESLVVDEKALLDFRVGRIL